tara:strand:+ start:207 stop:437 length:231 start_codon:yes stop_codon:yes gene_type:complete
MSDFESKTGYTFERLVSATCCNSCHKHIEIAVQRLSNAQAIIDLRDGLRRAKQKKYFKPELEAIFDKHIKRNEKTL